MRVATSETFGTRLKALRERAALTQAQLAERAGLSVNGIFLLESGLRDPSWGTLKKLVRALNVSLAEFDEPARSQDVIPGPTAAHRPSKRK